MYVVEMLRWGDRESHSYVIGVFSTLDRAILAGEAHKSWRACKYEYKISNYDIDHIPKEILNYHKSCI